MTGHRTTTSAAAPRGLSKIQVDMIERLETSVSVCPKVASGSATDLDRAFVKFQGIDSVLDSLDDVTNVCTGLLGDFFPYRGKKSSEAERRGDGWSDASVFADLAKPLDSENFVPIPYATG